MSEYDSCVDELDTILDFFRFAVSKANQAELFYGHGCDTAWDDMLVLTLNALDLPYDMDKSLLTARLTHSEKVQLAGILKKRIVDKIPTPYLTNKAYFCGLEFFVDERVLIPRSPIAELIENRFSPWLIEEEVNLVLDLCTGSGCIAIACAHAFPEAHIDGIDISDDALAVAKRNVEKLDRESQITLYQSDVFSSLPQKRYDIIVSNPPYVGRDEMATLPSEYNHEPVLALEAKDNGLAIVDKILYQAKDYLTEHGILVVEVGNSDLALMDKYPQVPFMWLEFEHGGSGVFILDKEQLDEYFPN